MLCPPVPWTSPDNGGYLIATTEFIRSDGAYNQIARIREQYKPETYPMLDALNHISNVPWTINTRVLEIIIQAFINMNEDDVSRMNKKKYKNTDLDADNALEPEVPKINQLYAKMRRSRGDIFYKLLIANHYQDKVFWFAHTSDYRGRIYPIPSILSYTASDVNRSLLLFDERKPLGPDGLACLKLYCVNLKGTKKRNSLQERLEYADASISEIMDSADNPLTGQLWWLESDEPWQTLAACIEITNAIRSPDPTQYLCSFPVQKDGTCNSLQHYAALCCEEELAISVNLTSTEQPQDAYTVFADALEKYRIEDAENGLEIAKALKGIIKRQTVKKSIQALVYGSGPARTQETIKKTLRGLLVFPFSLVDEAAVYLEAKERQIFLEKFNSARQVQKWLNKCSSNIRKHYKQNIEWVTPLDWLIIQPPNLEFHNVNEQFKKNEAGAIAPNFIHSLESSHMIMASLNCSKAGITFISEHDSFGTHPCSSSILDRIAREQFYLLHSEPILENLSKFFSKTYPL